ncbi:MAG: transposase, partial [Bacteroidia bacterium]
KLTQNKPYAKRMVRIRSKTVEPVIGTLVNFMNMKRVNTRGIKATNKHVLMASLVYNLQKYRRFIVKKPAILAQAIALPEGIIYASLKSVSVFIHNSILSASSLRLLCKN